MTSACMDSVWKGPVHVGADGVTKARSLPHADGGHLEAHHGTCKHAGGENDHLSRILPSVSRPFESILMECNIIALDYHDPYLPGHKIFEVEAMDICYQAPSALSVGPVLRRLWPQHRSGEEDQRRCRPLKPLILKNVSCVAKAGEILAIAGPSGAGKSTLLEVLAGWRRPTGSGSVLVNNQDMEARTFRRISGFVPQSDVLFPRLTVQETLMYSASLRLPACEFTAEKAAKVAALIAELGLQHVADARVGGEDIRGVSGGERRRVSIGAEMIHDPSILLLDEPTSGLDSASALNVINMLQSMAKARLCTIILSIHQPGYRIIDRINSFLLLANGAVVYHGSLQMLHYHLQATGHMIPAQVNVLEYALEAISTNSLLSSPSRANKISKPLSSNTCTKALDSCCILFDEGLHEEAHNEGSYNRCIDDVFQIRGETSQEFECASTMSTATSTTTSILTASSEVSKCMQEGTEKPSFPNSSSKEILILGRRFSRNLLRAHKLVMVRMLQALGAGIGLGTIYMNVGMDEKGVAERLGFFAFTLTFLISSSVEDLPIFLKERNVLERETSRGAYRVSSYVVANLLVFLPFLSLLALLYSLPVYYLIGLSSTPSAFLFFVLIVWLVLVMANSFAAFFSALAPDFVMANSLISGCMGASFLFSGYFISRESMPSYWRFMHYLSFFKYPLEALLINEYSSLEAQGKCFAHLHLPPSNPNSSSSCTFSPSAILQQLGLHQTHIWVNIAITIAFLSSYRLLFYIMLRIKASKRSR